MEKKFNFRGIDKIFIEDINLLSEKTQLKNLSNWDSLKQLELVSLLEKKFKKTAKYCRQSVLNCISWLKNILQHMLQISTKKS